VDHIEEQLGRELDCRPAHVEGRRNADWVLMDYFDFVVHVFVDEKRNFYRLERLWGDAPKVDVSELRSDAAERAQASLPPTGF